VEKWNFHLHITHDQADGVVNYRLDAADSALGALVCLLIGAYGNSIKSIPDEDTMEKIQRLGPNPIKVGSQSFDEEVLTSPVE